MSANSKIEWTTHTFNPWWGCTKVSPGCDNCYAERDGRRFGTQWGPGAPRRYMGDAYWNEPRKWNRRAELYARAWRAGFVAGATSEAHLVAQGFTKPERPRVFCASMADVFDNEVAQEHRTRLFRLIADTPALDWLLLTKRVGNVPKMLPPDWVLSGKPPPNVWLGISVVNQEEADRDVPKLLSIPARVRFLSCEPLLGPIDLMDCGGVASDSAGDGHSYSEASWPVDGPAMLPFEAQMGLDWVICGGESGRAARPMHPEWARSLRDQCEGAGVAYFFKQWGEWAPGIVVPGGDLGGDMRAGRATWVRVCGSDLDGHGHRGDQLMRRVGKRAAGRLLDGRTWDELPAATT